jgi:hypothetical protein
MFSPDASETNDADADSSHWRIVLTNRPGVVEAELLTEAMQSAQSIKYTVEHAMVAAKRCPIKTWRTAVIPKKWAHPLRII